MVLSEIFVSFFNKNTLYKTLQSEERYSNIEITIRTWGNVIMKQFYLRKHICFCDCHQSTNIKKERKCCQANPDKHWDWGSLSRNKFTKAKEEFEKRVSHQKFIQENILEELVKAYMHPKRIVMLLDMGYEIEELDDIMQNNQSMICD